MAGGLKGRNNKAQCAALGKWQGKSPRAESPQEGLILSWGILEPFQRLCHSDRPGPRAAFVPHLPRALFCGPFRARRDSDFGWRAGPTGRWDCSSEDPSFPWVPLHSGDQTNWRNKSPGEQGEHPKAE